MAKKKQQTVNAEIVNLDAISFDPNNYRHHPENNLDLITDSIKDLGFARSIVIDENNMLIAGEGATKGSRNAGLKEALIIDAEGDQVVAVRRKNLTAEQKERLKIIDNRTTELSVWNNDRLITYLNTMPAEQLVKTGFSDADLIALIAAANPDETADEYYSHIITGPVYEIQGECPTLDQLCDDTKVNELMQKISEADVPEPVRDFLYKAAYRHRVFNYQNIAEFYAHANPAVQQLFEELALVIIDFDKAIELGFVHLSEVIRESYLSLKNKNEIP